MRNRPARLAAVPAVLLALGLAAPAFALGVPDPRLSIVDPVLVGSPLGIPNPQVGGTPGFDVYARDVNNTPVAGAVVEIDFSLAGLTLYATQNAGTTVNCATHRIGQVTDAQGHVVFAAQFGSWQNANVVPVLINGVLVANVAARSPDYDEDGKVAIFDLSVFSTDFLDQNPTPRSDFDVSGVTGLGDLAFFSQHYLAPEGPAKPLCP